MLNFKENLSPSKKIFVSLCSKHTPSIHGNPKAGKAAERLPNDRTRETFSQQKVAKRFTEEVARAGRLKQLK